MNNCVLAADLGGTNLRMSAIGSDGTVICRGSVRTPRNRDEIVDAIVDTALECRGKIDSNYNIQGLGLAAAAIINVSEGSVFKAPNMPDLNGCKLSSIVEERLGMDVVLENDATAAGIGESWLGASRGFDSSICITLGTGVGGGIIIGGKPLRGIDGTAGEVGHICVEPRGAKCGCGSYGCLEQYSSASAVTRIAKELREQYPGSQLWAEEEITSLKIFDAGKIGDPLALEIFNRLGFYLGIGIAGLINVLNPEVIVIGGGAAAGWDLFIEPLRAEIRIRAFQEPAERARIVRAALGDDAGILGAAYLALGKAA